MKSFSIIKHGLMLALTTGLLVGLGGCGKENVIDTPEPPPVVPDGKVRLMLDTNTGDYQVPVTRAAAADEDATHAANRLPLVLVFEHPTGATGYNMNDAVFTEAVEAELVSGNLQVTLTKTDKPVRLLVVANAPTQIFNGTSNSAFTVDALNASGSILKSVTLKNAVENILNTVKLSNPQTAVPYSGGYITMTGVSNDTDNPGLKSGISGSTVIGNIALKRVAAKITVVNSASGFTLAGLTVANTKSYGYLYNNGIAAPTGNQVRYEHGTNPVTGIAGPSEPLYVYESAAGEAVVIVQGTYNSATYYYRIALKNASGTTLAVERDKHYKIEIKNVSLPGYTSLALALAGTGYSNIQSDVHVIELSGHEVQDNGSYYLAVSNSEFLYYSTVQTGTTTIATVSTDGGTPTVARVSGPSITPTLTSVSTGVWNVNMTLGSALTVGGTPLVVRVTMGNLTKDITIERKTPLVAAGASHLLGGSFVQGKIDGSVSGWSLLSNGSVDSGNELTQTAGNIYLKTTNNWGETARSGELYLFRQQENARTKVHLTQQAEKLIEDHELMNLPLDAHFDYRPLTIKLSPNALFVRVQILETSGTAVTGTANASWLNFTPNERYKTTEPMLDNTYNRPASGELEIYVHAYEYVTPDAADRTRTVRITTAPTAAALNETGNREVLDLSVSQKSINFLGYFGGTFTAGNTQPYSARLGIEHREEYLLDFRTGENSVSKRLPWGFSTVETTLRDFHQGKSNTKTLAENPSGWATGITPPYGLRDNTYAARYCYDKNRDLNNNGVIDANEFLWYLPAQNQTQAFWVLWSAITTPLTVGGSTSYWSATEANANNTGHAMRMDLGAGGTNRVTKPTGGKVRCVRDL